MARYGKGGLSTSIGSFGVDKPKQTLIRASEGYEGGMEGLVERAKEHGVGQWGHEAFGDNYYNDLKSDRGIAAYLVSQGRDGNYDPRVWQAERDEVKDDSDTPVAEPEPDPAPVYNEVEYPSRSTAKERVESYDSGKTMASIFGTGGTKELDEANVTNAMQEQAAEPGLNLQENPFDTQRKKSNIANMVTGQQAGLG